MAIYLQCSVCQSVLAATAQQLEGRQECPRCGGLLKITTAALAEGKAGPEATWQLGRSPEVWQRPERAYVTLPRRLIWAQGLLLLCVAAASFCCGLLVRSSQSHRSRTPLRPHGPASLVGQVQIRRGGSDVEPWAGAIVALWPVVSASDEKFTVEQLESIRRVDESTMIQQLRGLGGDIAVTGEGGHYRLQVAAGDYYWMVAAPAQTAPPATLSTRSLAQLGRYVLQGYRLVERCAVVWRQIHVRDQARLIQTFETRR